MYTYTGLPINGLNMFAKETLNTCHSINTSTNIDSNATHSLLTLSLFQNLHKGIMNQRAIYTGSGSQEPITVQSHSTQCATTVIRLVIQPRQEYTCCSPFIKEKAKENRATSLAASRVYLHNEGHIVRFTGFFRSLRSRLKRIEQAHWLQAGYMYITRLIQ